MPRFSLSQEASITFDLLNWIYFLSIHVYFFLFLLIATLPFHTTLLSSYTQTLKKAAGRWRLAAWLQLSTETLYFRCSPSLHLTIPTVSTSAPGSNIHGRAKIPTKAEIANVSLAVYLPLIRFTAGTIHIHEPLDGTRDSNFDARLFFSKISSV